MDTHRPHRSYPPLARLWHQVRARPRLLLSILAGLLVAAVLPPGNTGPTRALLAWDAGAGLYLALAWTMIGRASVEHLRTRARVQDDGATAVLILTVLAALASLAAIVMELSGLKALSLTRQGFHVAWVVATFLVSWLLVHTSFALHYAHVYYVALGRQGDAPPLLFPGPETPSYTDFLYFALVVGMTSQTADVAIATTRLRRLVMAHGMISFAFNTTLLALTINIAASLLG